MTHWDFPRTPTSINILLDLARERGLAPADCLRACRIDPLSLQDPQQVVAARDELAVARWLQQQLGDDRGLGLEAGLRYHLSSYGIFGFMMLSSPTLRSAVRLGLHFIELTFAFCRLREEVHGDDLWLVIDGDEVPADMRRFMIEREAAAIMTIQRELFAQRLPVRLTGIAAPGTDRRAALADQLGLFAGPADGRAAMIIPAALLDLPLPQANPATAALCEAQCRELVDRRRRRSGLSGQVRDRLLRQPGHMPGMAEVAAGLCLSLRSLHRHLEAEQTSFRALVDEVRETLAEELLASRGLGVAQVAERLGYGEPASFLRAFTRWKGMSPGRWAAQQAAGRTAGTNFHHSR